MWKIEWNCGKYVPMKKRPSGFRFILAMLMEQMKWKMFEMARTTSRRLKIVASSCRKRIASNTAWLRNPNKSRASSATPLIQYSKLAENKTNLLAQNYTHVLQSLDAAKCVTVNHDCSIDQILDISCPDIHFWDSMIIQSIINEKKTNDKAGKDC